MKMKAKLILKSLADLPANTFNFAVAAPGRAAAMTRQVLAPPVRATRRQLRAARRQSFQFMDEFSARARAPLQLVDVWSRGGLNE